MEKLKIKETTRKFQPTCKNELKKIKKNEKLTNTSPLKALEGIIP